jgi:hypothetical protein
MLSKSKLLYVLVVVGLICLAQSAWGKGSDSIDKPWKKYNLDIGYLITSLQGGGPQKLDNVLSYKSDLN